MYNTMNAYIAINVTYIVMEDIYMYICMYKFLFYMCVL